MLRKLKVTNNGESIHPDFPNPRGLHSCVVYGGFRSERTGVRGGYGALK
jgi:hypothetical protein